MILKSMSIKEKQSFIEKKIEFSDITILHSDRNSTGKTTLMRAILHGLGFSVPDTQAIKFKNYETTIVVERENEELVLFRKDNLLRINEVEYDLPIEQQEALSFLFNITNYELINNLLGTIYFDQEKGWTLLNRGTIIGANRFSIEEFFRGMNNDESEESYKISAELKEIDKKLSQYKLMLNVAEYQASVNIEIGKTHDFNSKDQELQTEIIKNQQSLSEIELEIRELDELIKKNKAFSDYISQKKIYVKIPNNDIPIRITKDNLLEYESLEDLNIARKNMLVAERNKLKRSLSNLEVQREKQGVLINIPTIDEEFAYKLSNLQGLNSIQIQGLIENLQKEKKNLSQRLINRTKFNNEWINKSYNIVKDFAKKIKLPDDVKLDIFTHDLKSKSGAILHKMVFVYKLAYIKVLSEKIGYHLPIFCDSPSGREIEPDTIKSMLNLLKEEFKGHQIIIASINSFQDIFPQSSLIQLDGTLFNKQTLFD